MTVETEISTPVDAELEDTSSVVEPAEESADTLTQEPEISDVTAETETQEAEQDLQQPVLYAGKYKSIEEFEKGYKELNGSYTKAQEYEKKYNELLRTQQEEINRVAQERLREAQSRGFYSVEEQEINDKVLVSELELYANNLNLVHPEQMEEVRQHLQNYYNTGNKAYLDAAKSYYSAEFVEAVALRKNRIETELRNEYQTKQNNAREESERKLAEALRADFSEFLADVSTNAGKAQALKSFCDVGSINSKEDMQVFADIYNQIAKYERELAIKEYEASKAIELTKQKSVIGSSAVNSSVPSGLKESYTAEEIGAMSLEEYNALCDKYGDAEIDRRIV